jgi:hypothetical protein
MTLVILPLLHIMLWTMLLWCASMRALWYTHCHV